MSQVLSLNLSIQSKAQKMPWRKYQRGEMISVLNSEVWQVRQGIVQLSRIRADDTEVVVGFITAKGSFENILSGSPVVYCAIALSDVYLQYYPLHNIAKSPRLARRLLASYGDRLMKTQQLSSILLIDRMNERLRQLLLMLKRDLGKVCADGVGLQVRFTHLHLAHILGTTRVTISLILKDFQNQGLIYLDHRRHIVIRSL
jgi:CRP-like cAMP-binding protein